MRNKQGYTPRELAVDAVIGWIRAVHNESTNDLADETPSFKRETKKQLVKLHNKLLDQSSLDGLPLGDADDMA